jgi:hypothetical protein
MDVDRIVQAGDFGYWEHTDKGHQFLGRLNSKLEKAGLKIHWIDGNHENHTVLRLNYGPGGNRHLPTPEGFWEIRPNINYIPRGTRWEWGGVSFLGIGGAYSIDKEYRTEGVSWWPEEMVTDAEVDAAVSGGQVDVVVSHDVPLFVDLTPHLMGVGITRPWKWDENSLRNRKQLSTVFDGVTPKRWYHGHYHLRYTESVDMCRFVGLAANINQFGDQDWSWTQSVVIVNTDEVGKKGTGLAGR